MRCIVVNDAQLKADACCARCGRKIGASYARDIDSRLIYCDFRCYGIAVETSIMVLGYRWPASSARMLSS